MTTLFQQGALESGSRFKIFDAAAIGAGIDLTTAYPGYGNRKRARILPRLIVFSGGALDVLLADESSETLLEIFAGLPLPIAPASVVDSSTATALLVVW